MKALVYHGPGEMGWDSRPDPGLERPSDAIVKIDMATICGTDLRIVRGDVPTVAPGRTLGHEAVGTVIEVGDAVETIGSGDRVLVPLVSSCGRCEYCRRRMYSQCQGGGGWILGHLVDGLQAEYARIPFADNSVHKVSEDLSDDQVIFLADLLPSGFEVGVLNGHIQPGDVVAVVGAGPVGLAAAMTARFAGPSKVVVIDVIDFRLELARSEFCADMTVNSSSEDPLEIVKGLTGGLGADVVIEAAGASETFELCTRLVRPGGRVANIGVHSHPAALHLEELWKKNITITTGLVDTYSAPRLLKLISDGQLDPLPLGTHHFKMDEIMDAYATAADAATMNALKVVLSAS
jgi:alcohol dehydrogenase